MFSHFSQLKVMGIDFSTLNLKAFQSSLEVHIFHPGEEEAGFGGNS